MKVCDRCKKDLDTEEESYLAGEQFELCSECAAYIAKHIKEYKNKKGFFS